MIQVNIDKNIAVLFPSLKHINVYNSNTELYIQHIDVLELIDKSKIKFDNLSETESKISSIYLGGVQRKVRLYNYSALSKINKKYPSDKLSELLDLLDILKVYPSQEAEYKLEIKRLKLDLLAQAQRIPKLEEQVELWKKKAEKKEHEFICLIEDYKIAMSENGLRDEVYALRDEVYTLKEKLKEFSTTDTKDINSHTFLKAIRQVECTKIWIEVVGCEDIREIETDVLCTMSLWDKKPVHCEVYNLPSFIPRSKSLKDVHEFLCKIGVGIPTQVPKIFQTNKYNCTIDVLRGLIDQFLFESYVKLADPKNNIGEYEPLEFDYKVNIKKATQPLISQTINQNSSGMPFEPDPDDLSIRNIYYKEANF